MRRLALVLVTVAGMMASAGGANAAVVISQVYGGGGNSGATWKNDFIELHNNGTTSVDLTGWSVQYASSTGPFQFVKPLSAKTVPAGGYYLIQAAAGAYGTLPLPTPDDTWSQGIGAASGKVALVSSTTQLTCPANPCTSVDLVDLIGYGIANVYEGPAPAPTLSNITAALRRGNGCYDTDNNSSDFTVATPNPRNSASPAFGCGGPPVNTSLPVVSGLRQVGQALTCTTGDWVGDPTISYTYQWLRNGSSIDGETASTHVVSDVDGGQQLSCTVTATNGVDSVSATSLPVTVMQYTLTVTRTGAGSGSVTSSPAGIDCPSTTCAALFNDGQTVTLTATAPTGSRLASWANCDSTLGNTCTVTVGSDRTVTAEFVLQHSLTVTKPGSGWGTVSSQPTGINCGSTCFWRFDDGQSVTLTATPFSGSVFGSWTGCDSTAGNTCTLTLTADTEVTATFVLQYTLAVTATGAGAGSVTSLPVGINCGSTCSSSFDKDQSVTLTATPSIGSAFGGWEGCDSTADNTCTVTMNGHRSASASFTDATPPEITVPGRIIGEAASGAGVAITYDVTATDNVDGTVEATCDPLSGSTFPLGVTTVNCTAKDAAGNVANRSFEVEVKDTVAPVLNLPASMTVEATGPTGAIVRFTANAFDPVDGAEATTCVPASGSTFKLGTTVVTCSAKDKANNSASKSFNVLVRDTRAPAITVPRTIVAIATGRSGAVVRYSASARDLVDGAVTPSCSPASGRLFAIGTTTVRCSAADKRGNRASASFKITVRGVITAAVKELRHSATCRLGSGAATCADKFTIVPPATFTLTDGRRVGLPATRVCSGTIKVTYSLKVGRRYVTMATKTIAVNNRCVAGTSARIAAHRGDTIRITARYSGNYYLLPKTAIASRTV